MDLAPNRPIQAPPPLIAIVGRPNVGKSTLFNRLLGSRRAIVHDQPGVTRDPLIGDVAWSEQPLRVADTGGIDQDAFGLYADVTRAALEAALTAAVIILVVDGRTGLLPVDAEIATRLARLGRPVVLAVNKLDTPSLGIHAADFAPIGIERIIAISAEHALGMDDLLDAVVACLPDTVEQPIPDPVPAETERAEPIAVALVGRPNVGKSTLFNQLLGGKRSLVSPVAGTTRDSVDALSDRGGLRVRFVDTAGMRRKGKTEEGPEKLAMVMVRRAIEDAHVVVVVLDGSSTIAHQDAAVAGLADEMGKGIILALTKWDLVTDGEGRRAAIDEELERQMVFLRYAPRLTLSGATGRGVVRLRTEIARVDENCQRRISTPDLNRAISQRLASLRLPAIGKRSSDGRILYATQVAVRPPTFAFFVNRRVEPHFSTLRRITNVIRDLGDFRGTPIRIQFRAKR